MFGRPLIRVMVSRMPDDRIDMATLAHEAKQERIRGAMGAVVALIALAVVAYCVWTLELMLVVPPAVASLTAGAGVVGSIGPRLESRVARASAAIVVPLGFACLAFVMITVMMRLMYHGGIEIGVMALSALGVGTYRFSAPFWVAAAATALLYSRDPGVGSVKLASTAFRVSVLATAAMIATLYL